MNEESKNLLDTSFKFIAMIGSFIAFAFTIATWKEEGRVKRAEFLESRIKEFNDSSTYLARAILDSFGVRSEKTSELTIQQLVDSGSSGNDTADIGVWNLDSTLLRKWPVTKNSEHRIRQSFDNMLDFFGKLEYYINLKLMTEDELYYFKYFLESSAKRSAVILYAKKYEFRLFLSLLDRIKIVY